MNIDFKDKVVFVTGAAAGLGRATALCFAEHGATLSLLDVNEAGLAETKAMVEALGCACLTQAIDVSHKAHCDAAIGATVEHFGRLDVLANVAGIVALVNAVEVSEESWQRMLNVNLSGPFYLCQAAIPHLLKTEGNIVNVASVGGLRGSAYLVPYSASKAGLIQMTRSLAMEYMHKPIRINAVAPGAMATPMGSHQATPTDFDASLAQRFFNVRPASQPEEIARFIVYVASNQTQALHGACLSVDTGVHAG